MHNRSREIAYEKVNNGPIRKVLPINQKGPTYTETQKGIYFANASPGEILFGTRLVVRGSN